LLDHERSLREMNLQRGVVQVAHGAPLQMRGHRLVGAAVESDEASSGPEGQPVQVNPCGHLPSIAQGGDP
jgi:hypothetical protein